MQPKSPRTEQEDERYEALGHGGKPRLSNDRRWSNSVDSLGNGFMRGRYFFFALAVNISKQTLCSDLARLLHQKF